MSFVQQMYNCVSCQKITLHEYNGLMNYMYYKIKNQENYSFIDLIKFMFCIMWVSSSVDLMIICEKKKNMNAIHIYLHISMYVLKQYKRLLHVPQLALNLECFVAFGILLILMEGAKNILRGGACLNLALLRPKIPTPP